MKTAHETNRNLRASDVLLAFLRGRERFRAQPYLDLGRSGVWTIGYGHTGKDVTVGTAAITRERGEELLRADVAVAESAVRRMVVAPLNQQQYDALVSFVFNVGAGAFDGSTLLRLLNEGRYAGAAAEFPRWCHDDGAVVPELEARRAVEVAWFNGKEPVVTG